MYLKWLTCHLLLRCIMGKLRCKGALCVALILDMSPSSSQHSEGPGPDPLLCRAGGTSWKACVNCFCRDHLLSLLSSPAVTQAGIPSLCIHSVFHEPWVNSSLPAGTLMASPEHLECISKIVGWRMTTLPCHVVFKKKKKEAIL